MRIYLILGTILNTLKVVCPTVATVCILFLTVLITFQNNTAGPTYSTCIV